MLYKNFKFHRVEKPYAPTFGLKKYWFEIELPEQKFIYIFTWKDLSGWGFSDASLPAGYFIVIYDAILTNLEYINSSVKNS